MSLGELEVTGSNRMDHDIRNSSECERISEMLSRVGDKWTILIIRRLGTKSQRFNALRREIGDISQKMLATTLRNLELIGEAATHIPDEIRQANEHIAWRQIVSTRNRLIHGYLGIDNDILWNIINVDTPLLLSQLVLLNSRNEQT